ncbi:MAG: hypothetical protein IPH72_10715 [Sandaracinaceae bacterium]|nr:hypothetical protein [Sandaracinaceae bacterium]
MRHARTSEDVTFTLYSANTGAREHDLPWLATALPRWERTYTHRFTFAGPWVSGHRGRAAHETTVPALETSAIAWRQPWPSTIQLFEGDDEPLAFVIDSAQPRVGVVAVASGVWRWSAPKRTPRDARGGDPALGARSRATRTTPKSRARWWRGP